MHGAGGCWVGGSMDGRGRHHDEADIPTMGCVDRSVDWLVCWAPLEIHTWNPRNHEGRGACPPKATKPRARSMTAAGFTNEESTDRPPLEPLSFSFDHAYRQPRPPPSKSHARTVPPHRNPSTGGVASASVVDRSLCVSLWPASRCSPNRRRRAAASRAPQGRPSPIPGPACHSSTPLLLRFVRASGGRRWR